MTLESTACDATIWAEVEDGFYVCSRDGTFLGYVDRRADGRLVAFDMHSQETGDFGTLDDARFAVESVAPQQEGAR